MLNPTQFVIKIKLLYRAFIQPSLAVISLKLATCKTKGRKSSVLLSCLCLAFNNDIVKNKRMKNYIAISLLTSIFVVHLFRSNTDLGDQDCELHIMKCINIPLPSGMRVISACLFSFLNYHQ